MGYDRMKKLIIFFMLLSTSLIAQTQGDIVTLNFTAQVLGQCSSVGFHVVYDSTFFEYDSNIKYSKFDVEQIGQQHPGRVICGFSNNTSGPLQGVGFNLMILKLKAIKAGATMIRFENAHAYLAANEIEGEYVNKQLEILEQIINKIIINIEIQ